jgi:hypothetical protein
MTRGDRKKDIDESDVDRNKDALTPALSHPIGEGGSSAAPYAILPPPHYLRLKSERKRTK